MTGTTGVAVTVTQTFSAKSERVFDAFFDSRMIGQWMFGPRLREEDILHLNVDARVGGTFSFLVRRQGTDIDHVGTYREIDRHRRIVFTWGIAGMSVDETVVEIDIMPTASGCALTLTHRNVWTEYADRTRTGWATMLKALNTLFNEKPA